jgi:single-strand DNA-binding protein
MLNQVNLIGRLGANPEIRKNDATPAVFVSLATSEYWRDRQGRRQEHTEWHSLAFWASNAENVAKIAEQGDLIAVQGKLRTRSEEVEGVSRQWTSIIVDTWQLLKKAGTQSENSDDAPEAA